jgi:phosphatidate cytidylyltransferase
MSLGRRVASAGLLIPLVGAALFLGPTWLFAAVTALVALVSMDEWFSMRGQPRGAVWPAYLLAAATSLSFTDAVPTLAEGLPMIALLTVGASAVLRGGDLAARMSAAGDMVMGLACIALPLSHFIAIRRDGAAPVAFLLVAVWASDTAAFAAGVTMGRHRLAPLLSPKKSWEGFAGAVAGGAVAGAIVGHLAMVTTPVSGFLIGALLGAAGQLGDLFESLWKRASGVKDSGSIIPGHGGLLDRVDSFLFAAPLFYYLGLLMSLAP